jgi:AcrR family transcriptional regulator
MNHSYSFPVPPSRTPERLLAIVDAATEVFAQRGYASAQMLDVARGANVSVGTLYNYVEGKGALLLLCAERPFADIAAGRSLPVPTPDRDELIARLDHTLATHVRVHALDRALGEEVPANAVEAQMREIVGELFDLLAATRVAADAMERSARDAPDLAELFYRRVRVRLLDQLVEYLTRAHAARPPAAPLTPEIAARAVLETVTWWARHRHRDPAPPVVDEAQAREIAVILATGSLGMRPVGR